MQKKLVLVVSAAIVTIAQAGAAQSFTFEELPGRIEIRHEGAPFATYVYEDETIPRPYFCNVYAPNGEQITRRHPTDPVANKDNDDHPAYHPGIWLAFGDLGGEDFWRNRARVRHVRFVQKPSPKEHWMTFMVENSYESTSNPPRVVCMERCTYNLISSPAGFHIFNQSNFSSEENFAFGDQEEMGLGVRIATRYTVQHGTGTIRNSEGGVNEKETWGRAADWCAYYTVNDGTRTGIAIMPSTMNVRRSWFHTRNYGLMVANPFGKKAMTGANDDNVQPSSITVQAGQSFRLGFGVHIFSEPDDGAYDGAKAFAAYAHTLQK